MRLDPCSVCDDTDYNELDAEYFCNTCGTKYDGAKDMEAEIDFHNKSLGFTKIRETRKIHVFEGVKQPKGRKLHTLQLCQMILLQQIDALIKLGAHPKLKELVYKLWVKVLAAKGKAFYDEKLLSNNSKRNAKPSKTPTKKPRLTPKGKSSKSNDPLEGTDEDDDVSDEEDVNEELEENDEQEVDERSARAKSASPYTKLLYDITLALCFLGLKYTNPYTMLSDLIRWAIERKVPFLNAEQYFPKDVNVSKLQQAFFNKAQGMLDPFTLLMKVKYFANFLQLKGFPKISMKQLVKKYIIRLNLPDEMHSLSTRLGDCETLIQEQPHWTFFEGIAMSYIILLLKILFGLNGHSEREICSCTRQLMELTNHKHQLFLFDDWLTYLKERHISSRNAVLQADNAEVENSPNTGINAKYLKVFAPLSTLSKIWKVTEGRVVQPSLKDKEERFRNSSIKYLLHPEDFIGMLDRLNLSNITIKSICCMERDQDTSMVRGPTWKPGKANSCQIFDTVGMPHGNPENSINISCEKQTPHDEANTFDLAEVAENSFINLDDSVNLEDLLNTSVSNSDQFGNDMSSTSYDNQKSLVDSYRGVNESANDENKPAVTSNTEINNSTVGTDISGTEAGAHECVTDSKKSTMDSSLRISLRKFLLSKINETLITDRDQFDTVVQTIQDVCDMLHSNYRLCNTKFGPTNHTFDSLLEVCADMLYMPTSALHFYLVKVERFVVVDRPKLVFGIQRLKRN